MGPGRGHVARSQSNSKPGCDVQIMTDQTIDRTPTADDLGRCVTGLVNAVARGMEEQLAPWGLSAVEFSILGVVYRAKETTVSEIASVIPVDSGRISRVVHKFWERGLISRERMSSDRRVVQLRLTDEGGDLVPHLVQLVEDYNQILISDISDKEFTQFLATCRKIIENRTRLRPDAP